MLERILGSKSKIRILRELFGNIDREFSMENLVKATGMSFGTVHPAIGDLLDTRMVITQKIGRSKVYRINKTHVLFPQLKTLLERESSVFRDIAYEFGDTVEKNGIENILLYGSVARGEVIEAGDVDLLIIYTDPNVTKRIDQLAGEFLEKYDVVISPIYLSKKETMERLEKFDDFILRAVDEGVFLYGDDSWLKK